MGEASEALTALQKVAAAQTASTARFNTELVRSAWSAVQRRQREARRAARRAAGDLGGHHDMDVAEADPEYGWIDQLWTDHVIVRHGDREDSYARIPFTVEAPGTAPEHVKFGKPEAVRQAFVAASRGSGALERLVKLSEESSEEVALARVRTMAGARRYRKPIGTELGSGAPGGEPLATVAKTGSRKGSGVTSDKLRGAMKAVSKEQTYKGGKVFGDIGSEGKLKTALSQIARLPDDKRGEAAAEVVKAAQALGMTSLVPADVKRMYRRYIAQGSEKKSPKTKDK